MALEMPFGLQALTGDPAITYTGQQFRGLVEAFVPQAGVTMEGDLKVTQRAAGANMSVDVAAGQAAVRGTSIARQGTYMLRSTAVENVPIATAHATLPRIDLIVAQVLDRQADGGGTYGWQLVRVAGVENSSPVPPAAPASSLVLAHVRVNAAVSSIVAADITDVRPLNGLGSIPTWDLAGQVSPAQSIAANTVTTVRFSGTRELVGVKRVGVDDAHVKIITPGRYSVHFTFRLGSTTGTILRQAMLDHLDVNNFRPRRITQATESKGGAVTVSGTLRLALNETVQARYFHNHTAALTPDDVENELDFSGAWIGP